MALTHLSADIQADIEAVGRISVVPTLLEVICRTTGMGFAAIARVTGEKWVACGVRDEIEFGLKPGSELELETTICHEIRQSGEGVIIDHVDQDPAFCKHHTPKMYGFQSYISLPITLKNGKFFGTLCAIDPRPAQVNNPKTIGMFKLFADLISFHLENLEQLVHTETKLQEERKIAELREQFIAILGHDLRNPVSAISNSAQLLLRVSPDGDIAALANIIKNSSYRMTGLIENILDFARGRLGAGIKLDRRDNEPMVKILNEVITELSTIWPQRVLETKFDLAAPVNCDGNRIAQLFSNLLGNAISYGQAGTPVRIEASSDKSEFRLSVVNSGDRIPAATLDRIFHPFSRGEIKPGQQGLGLGLYIASEIARAHEGRLEVDSTDEETRFTLTMPAQPPHSAHQ
jgi:signal transduction histidine kinase